MKVSTKQDFQLIYSLFEHEYLGYLFESFVIQLNEKGGLTFAHQNISAKNAEEFSSGLDEMDFEIIELMDSIQQDIVYKKFNNKRLTIDEFFLKVFDKEKGDKILQEAITNYVDERKSKILPMLRGKEVYIMGNDGEPAWKRVEVPEEKATVLFHFRKNEDNTHYFPTLKFEGQKMEFQYNGSQILCNNPAWMLVGEERVVTFKKGIEGKKLKPFLNKKFIMIPEKVEETYYKNFVTQLVANYDVYAKGFEIDVVRVDPNPLLTFKELAEVSAQGDLFSSGGKEQDTGEGKLVFDLQFKYDGHNVESSAGGSSSVTLDKIDGVYHFKKISRNLGYEKEQIEFLRDSGLEIRHSKVSVPKSQAISWINKYRPELEQKGYVFKQETLETEGAKKYFIGESSINVEVKENNDWFDIHAVVRFGEYEIPFLELRKYILAKQTEFTLPNGEIAIIPSEWVEQYSDLLEFSNEEDGIIRLQKHHIALLQDLANGNLAKVNMSKKLESLKDFDHIDDYPLPTGFNGELRPYQKAGYNWMRFLSDYHFGGCLADDMGLGKTVQTLAMLLDQKEKGKEGASLLIMPTSLVYNWEVEAKKFTPDLKVFTYTGTYRDKNVKQFNNYDVIITSYGIARLDAELLQDYYFNYIILDESQNIKNPNSNIAKAVNELKSNNKLILSGTPIENSTMDLWSQMSFVNPGLLGSQSFFKKTFQTAIEKKADEKKRNKLHSIIKPFLLRRKKNQVLTDLPPKIEQVMYCQMTTEQSSKYEETKSFYRNKILEEIDLNGVNKSQIVLLQGLTKLRQIANHPRMVEEDWEGDSGKLDRSAEMLSNAIAKGHKVLVFSQFVKHLSIFRKRLDEQGLNYAYLDGSTKNRQEQVELFQNNEDIPVFLISLKAGGLGLNLTAADYVFILDPWWNPAIEAQAVDRAYRIGQKNTVHTYKFITRNSVEEKILKLQDAKRQLADDLITTEESFVKTLTKSDIEDILG